jgi:hypothetical protein
MLGFIHANTTAIQTQTIHLLSRTDQNLLKYEFLIEIMKSNLIRGFVIEYRLKHKLDKQLERQNLRIPSLLTLPM